MERAIYQEFDRWPVGLEVARIEICLHRHNTRQTSTAEVLVEHIDLEVKRTHKVLMSPPISRAPNDDFTLNPTS